MTLRCKNRDGVMKNTIKSQGLLGRSSVVEAHIHTHLCDGTLDMTVENIARRAEMFGIDTVILTPRFHWRVSDSTDALYRYSDESIFFGSSGEI